jgi:hypothetical protein
MNANHRASLASAIAGADASGERLPNLPSGNHHIRVDKCDLFTGRNGDDFFIAEMTVVGSDQPATPAGLRVSYLQKLSGTSKDPGIAAVKRFFLACGGYDSNNKDLEALITMEQILLAIGDEQPYRGVELYVTGQDTETRSKKWIVTYQWQLFGHAPAQPPQGQPQAPAQPQPNPAAAAPQQAPQGQYQQPPQQGYAPPQTPPGYYPPQG